MADDDSSPPADQDRGSRARPAGPGPGYAAPVVNPRERLRVREDDRVDERIRTVAHDFNHFLTAIIGSVQLALEELPPDAPAVEDLRIALESARRASSLTRSMLDTGEVERPPPRTVDLVEVVRDAGGMLERLVGDAVRVELQLPAHPVPVRVHAATVERVLVNLVSNGRDAVEGAGAITVALRTGDGSADGEAVIEVSDDGPGMSREERRGIFEPFVSTKRSGTGLGLAIVRHLVEEAGGSVEVESAPGTGTLFRTRFPLAEGRRGRGEREGSPNRQERVLIVGGDAAAREVASEALRRRGYRTRSAGGLDAALELLDGMDEPPELLVTDVGHPEPWGFELADSVRERREDAAVLFLAGDPAHGARSRRPPGRQETFLDRPFSIGELLAAVRRARGSDGGPTGRARGGA